MAAAAAPAAPLPLAGTAAARNPRGPRRRRRRVQRQPRAPEGAPGANKRKRGLGDPGSDNVHLIDRVYRTYQETDESAALLETLDNSSWEDVQHRNDNNVPEPSIHDTAFFRWADR